MNLTPEEREQIEGEIRALKSLLVDTDYNSNKIIESMTATLKDVTEEEFTSKFITWVRDTIINYGEIVERRAAWRTRINELQRLLDD